MRPTSTLSSAATAASAATVTAVLIVLAGCSGGCNALPLLSRRLEPAQYGYPIGQAIADNAVIGPNNAAAQGIATFKKYFLLLQYFCYIL